MTGHLTVGLSFYVWSFLLWSFYIWYKVNSSICYTFSPLFLFHWFSQVRTKFLFTSETPVILLLLSFLPSNAAKKRLGKNVEHKLQICWHKRRCSTETLHFTQCPNFSTTSQTYLSLHLLFAPITVETCL